jgi:hypothetical protein
MAVKSLEVELAIGLYVPDFKVITIGTKVGKGEKFDVIFIAFEPTIRQEDEWVESLRKHLRRNGRFIK